MFVPSGDSKVVYVSSSGGNDANSGLSETKAKKTLAAGVALLRNGFPDFLLLKRGDAWDEAFGSWKKYGRSATEPMVVWSYGPSLKRPVLRTGSKTAILTDGRSGTPELLHSLVFSGIHFYAHTRDQYSSNFTGIAGGPGVHWLRHSRDITFDDCKFQAYHNGMNVQDFDQKGVTRFAIRRCVFVDSYTSAQGVHSQGIFASGVTTLLIEDCVFDRNGHGELADASDDPTIFNHNLYLQYSNALDVVVRRNIICRASSHGIQLRSGGVIENNLFFRNPINIQCGYDTPVPGAKADVVNNVVLECTDISPSLPRGWGLNFKNLVSARVERNIVAHQTSAKVNRRSIEVWPNVTYKDNVVYDWPVGTAGRGWGETLETPGPWKDPNRSIAKYCGSLGLPATVDTFYARIRAQSRAEPDPRFTAETINAYFVAGFQKP